MQARQLSVLVVCGLIIGAAPSAKAASLPGAVGPVRYFESLDDGTRLMMVDWTFNDKQHALIQLLNSSAPAAGTVFAYTKKDAYYSSERATNLTLRTTDNGALYQGTVRKLWMLYGTSERDKGVRYVELQPPAGSPTAQTLVDAYVEHEGGTPSDASQVKRQIETEIASACGNRPKVTLTGLGTDGLLGKSKAAASGIADLCRRDNDYKAALAKISDVRFEPAKDAMTVTKSTSSATIAVAITSLNTRETILQWFTDNL